MLHQHPSHTTQIVNVLVHGPSLNLAQGWHRLQIISNQRMPAGNPNAGQLRRRMCGVQLLLQYIYITVIWNDFWVVSHVW